MSPAFTVTVRVEEVVGSWLRLALGVGSDSGVLVCIVAEVVNKSTIKRIDRKDRVISTRRVNILLIVL